MTHDLREALDRLADTTPAPEPTSATSRAWTGGRRLRRRDRITTAALSLGLVASLGGLAAVVLDRPEDDLADRPDGRGAVPARLHVVPERLTHHDESGTRWDEGLGTDDLAIGRASVAFLSGYAGAGLPVLVDADDGTHHLVDLPGWVGADIRGLLPLSDGPGLSLSPDGRRLAWAYGRPAAGREDYAPVDSGIRIADLATGEVRDVDLRPLLTTGQALIPHTMVWSPDGSVLGWRGSEMRQWNASGSGTDLDRQLGLVDVAAGRVRSVAIPGTGRASNVAIAATDAAELVAVREDGSVWVWRAGQVRGTRRSVGQVAVTPVAAASVGRALALGSAAPVSSMAILDLDAGGLGQRSVAGVYDDEGLRVQPLGWLDATHAVALVTPEDQRSSKLVVMTSGNDPDNEDGWYVAAEWEVSLDRGVSVAVDLLGVAGGETGVTGVEEFAAPQWPWSNERIALTAALVVLALVAAGVLITRRRRLW